MSQNQSSVFNVSGLLGNPGDFAARLRDTERFARPAAFLGTVSLLGAALFGFAVGSFVDIQVAFADSAKMVGIVAFSFVLTYPTMYVFASISGCTLSPARLLGLGLVATATLGCILAALAPVLWLFAVSTETVGFIVVFATLLAGIGAFFALSALARSRQAGVVASTVGLTAWFAVFAVVALQTVTLVRPMLAPLGSARNPAGKCFFLSHYARAVLDYERSPQ